MTKDEGREFTPEQLAAMGTRDVVALLRRNSGDTNFYWQVREAVLNRAADEIEKLAGRAHEPKCEPMCGDCVNLNGVDWVCTKPADHADHERHPQSPVNR